MREIDDNPSHTNNGYLSELISRESERRGKFNWVFRCALTFIVVYFSAFLVYLVKTQQHDWHIALMLVLPPTTILMSLIRALRPRSERNEEDNTPQMFEHILRLLNQR